MSAQILLLDRVEFTTVKIEANIGEFKADGSFPQLAVIEDDLTVFARSELAYPPGETEDPRHFMLTYGVKIEASESGQATPYDIEIEAAGFFRYVGGDEFKEERRFRAVRFSGYQILYGAIREMVSNVTARSRHGLWHLPARNFGAVAEAKANEDEAERKAALAKAAASDSRAAKKKTRSVAAKPKAPAKLSK